MKMNKKIITILFSVVITIIVSMITCAAVVYKDISSISIRTNFNIDYESVNTDGVPDITYNSSGNNSDMVSVYETAKYEIENCEWYSDGTNEFEIGGKPKVVVYLVTKDYTGSTSSSNDYYYRFLSSYSSSSCFISNAEFVSSTRLSTSTMKLVFALKGLKGTFNPPQSAIWADDYGNAKWEPANVCDSGYYDLILYRENSTVARIDKYKGTTYNFSSYMTREGDYSFKVRTTAGTDNQSTYGKNSEYLDSGAITIDESIIAKIKNGVANTQYNPTGGSGATNVGWVRLNNIWHFYRPDGQMVRNGWIQWQGKWYYLDAQGNMLTGLQTINDKTYFLNSDGTMTTGWINMNDSYYYFSNESGNNNGAMIINNWLNYENNFFYFDENGIMVTGWKQIRDVNGNNAFYYFYPRGAVSGLFGYMATNTTIDGFRIGADGKWTQN